jgi:S1-C subfamily serine protease
MHAVMRPTRAIARLGIVAVVLFAGATDRPEPGDDWTFRPTVMIRKESSQGSGTIIATRDTETLVLTAGHVIDGEGAIVVELHRYNLGLERTRPGRGWPRRVPAEVVALDADADIAVLRIRNMVALPYVARLAREDGWPVGGTLVTSIGIDRGDTFRSWPTRVVKLDRFTIEGNDAEREFIVTADAPDHGRSGGGLFLQNGDLAGVCIGRASRLVKGKVSGVYASPDSIRRLLRRHDLEAQVFRPARAPVTPTRAKTDDRGNR